MQNKYSSRLVGFFIIDRKDECRNMHLRRIPSFIGRILMQRLESREAKKEIVSDGENIWVMNSEQETVHVIREQGARSAVEDDGSVSTSLRDDLVGDDLSRLFAHSFVPREYIFRDEEPSLYSFDDVTHFGKQSATFFSDFAHELIPVDPFDCFVEQVLNSMTFASLRVPSMGTSGDIDIDIVSEFQLSSSPNLNHYHQYVDQSSFNDDGQFSEISPSLGEQLFAEVQQGTGEVRAKDGLGTHDFGTVEGILGGERLSAGDDDLINFYDGEPIEIGVPVILEPINKSSDRIVENGDKGIRNASGGGTNERGKSLHVSLSEFDDITSDLLDCGRGDVSLTFHSDKSWAGHVLILEKFELGGDSLRIESLLETETMETLLDNRPVESVGEGGEQSLCFSIAADSGAGYTISFLGMSLDEYMDFLSSTVKDLTGA